MYNVSAIKGQPTRSQKSHYTTIDIGKYVNEVKEVDLGPIQNSWIHMSNSLQVIENRCVG